MLTLSFLTLLALPAQAESPPCDCLDGPLLTGAPLRRGGLPAATWAPLTLR